MQRLDGPLHGATDVDGVLDVLVSSLVDLIENDPGFFVVLFDCSRPGGATRSSAARSAPCFASPATTSRGR